MKPLAIDLFCGLGGWTDALLAEGWDVLGFDITRHDYGTGGYPAQLVLQDILTLHGSQFRNAAVIVASPPCQKYSYMAMPWLRAKALAAEYRDDAEKRVELNALFRACFRIQREASEAAGHHIPMVVENVKGAQPWVGRARWHYGSFYLFGDVPALMPLTAQLRCKDSTHGLRFEDGLKLPEGNARGARTSSERPVQRLCDAFKVPGLNWSGSDKSGYVAKAFNDTAVKGLGGGWFGDYQKQKVTQDRIMSKQGESLGSAEKEEPG